MVILLGAGERPPVKGVTFVPEERRRDSRDSNASGTRDGSTGRKSTSQKDKNKSRRGTLHRQKRKAGTGEVGAGPTPPHRRRRCPLRGDAPDTRERTRARNCCDTATRPLTGGTGATGTTLICSSLELLE
ncbi:hypothetical protein EVAR_4273_1 [Eumeta japonica]|uniref:Uncharacterized protein n=1 Tax=Eumeta variegata TaxID=151549 RepID=A0A4C1Z7C3_EUMVA|nr:hypothetical protein EVAR_4273_1 [Eumeta japonica]